jgi:cbb3-type cytochrome oxidase subunit 3
MSKEMTIIVLGFWVAVVPYLGIPSSWRVMLLVLTGILLAIVGFLLRGESLSRNKGSSHHPFVENDSAERVAYLEHEPQDGITSLN